MHLRFVFLFLFPTLVEAQTFSEGRFIAKNNALLWTEKFEIKDMDEPIIAETIIEQLSSKEYVRFDSLPQYEIVYGQLISPFFSIAKARFRVDILYERYIVTVSDIIQQTPEGQTVIEKTFLDSNGCFNKLHLKSLDQLDSIFMQLFEIKQ